MVHCYFLKTLLATIVATSFGTCLAAAWQPLGPSGGWVSTIAFNPLHNTFLASLGY